MWFCVLEVVCVCGLPLIFVVMLFFIITNFCEVFCVSFDPFFFWSFGCLVFIFICYYFTHIYAKTPQKAR